MSPKLLFEIPFFQLDEYPLDDALGAKVRGEWKAISTSAFIENIQNVSRGLLAKGVERGEHVGIISFNRPEWNYIDLGLQQIGAINVPLYPNISKEAYQFILNDAGIKKLFVEDQELFNIIKDIKSEVNGLEEIYTFEPVEAAAHWSEVTQAATAAYDEQIEQRKSEIREDDLATIIYTSGTTGDPKGVMLSHKNIMSNAKACKELLPLEPGSKALSFLPLNHVFERTLTYVYMLSGLSIYYAEDLDSIGDNAKEIKPNIFTTVPRLLEKVYETIVSEGKKQNFFVRTIFFAALGLARNYELSGKNFLYKWLLNIADDLVFTKWRDALGGDLKLIVSGGAALNPKLARIFTAAGLPILEGYGLTETSPVIAVNRWEVAHRKFGTVGKPLAGVDVKIADDDEILCKGPNVMQGYFNQPEKTKEVLDADGWFHTGDVGHLDDDGFLSVTDRKDSVFKTSGGKKVAPQPIENTLEESFLIAKSVVLGEGRKMVTALISPDFGNLKKWCQQNGISWAEQEDVIHKGRVIQRYNRIVNEKNEAFNHTEQVKEFRLVADEWTVENGVLTPTQKVKRPVIKEKYEDLINEMYET
jgi:long-chain acyl-CoA synthetase